MGHTDRRIVTFQTIFHSLLSQPKLRNSTENKISSRLVDSSRSIVPYNTHYCSKFTKSVKSVKSIFLIDMEDIDLIHNSNCTVL